MQFSLQLCIKNGNAADPDPIRKQGKTRHMADRLHKSGKLAVCYYIFFIIHCLLKRLVLLPCTRLHEAINGRGGGTPRASFKMITVCTYDSYNL
jgi:hypothetical protein